MPQICHPAANLKTLPMHALCSERSWRDWVHIWEKCVLPQSPLKKTNHLP